MIRPGKRSAIKSQTINFSTEVIVCQYQLNPSWYKFVRIASLDTIGDILIETG